MKKIIFGILRDFSTLPSSLRDLTKTMKEFQQQQQIPLIIILLKIQHIFKYYSFILSIMYQEEILYKNSRIKVIVDKKELVSKAYDELVKERTLIEEYIKRDKLFESSLEPIKTKEYAHFIVKLMAKGGKIANVGPMAAVAGVIAEFVCRKLIKLGAKVAIIENGGDIFAVTEKTVKVGLFSGNSKLSGKLAFELNKKNTPIAICSSSSFLGHSLSFGKCDLATVFSSKSYIADAVATAVGNRIKSEEDIQDALEWAISLEGVDGVIVIKNDKIGVIGKVPELIKAEDKKIKEKVTKDSIYKL